MARKRGEEQQRTRRSLRHVETSSESPLASPPRKLSRTRSSDIGEARSIEEATLAEIPSPAALQPVDEAETPFSQSYFRARESEGVKSSIKKLSDLDVVSENELRTALSRVPVKHRKQQETLLNNYKNLYSKWQFQLRCNFGLLMYGFGSKKALLEDFASSTLIDGSVVVVNGYLPTLYIKSVVFMVAEALWLERNAKKTGSKSERPSNEHNVDELITYLDDKGDNFYVYVIVHNIDGPSLRDDDTQRILANLAACSHVRFVASVDHVNSSLLWDKRMTSTKFNWCWHSTPTYVPYTVESTQMPCILISSGSTKSARSALLVLQSLTPNAQSVFGTLANYQLTHPEEQGLSLHKLYTLCRERFLVSSELTLRSHLTEFKDHELVRTKRGVDGQDCLFIPLASEAITKLLEQINIQ